MRFSGLRRNDISGDLRGQERDCATEGGDRMDEEIGYRRESDEMTNSSAEKGQIFKKKRLTIFLVILGLLILVPIGLWIKDRMERSDPNLYLRHQQLGESYFSKADFRNAAEEFEKAVSLRPDLFVPHYALAVTYLKLRDLESAVQEFNSALKINPVSHSARYSLGVTLQRMGRYDEALREYQELYKAIPNNVLIYNNVGLIHYKVKSFEKAEQAFQIAIRLKPDYYNSYFGLAKVYEAQGRMNLARNTYEKLRKKASEKVDALKWVKIANNQIAALGRKDKGETGDNAILEELEELK